MKLAILLLSVFSASLVLGQVDSTAKAKEQANKSYGIGTQLCLSTLGFLIGYIPDGYRGVSSATAEDVKDVDQKAGWISPWITPFLTSAGADCANTNFWRNKNAGGSYWGGVLGGFLGEITGTFTVLGVLKGSRNQHSYILFLLSYLIPTNLFTVSFYNIFGDSLDNFAPFLQQINLTPSFSTNGIKLQLGGVY